MRYFLLSWIAFFAVTTFVSAQEQPDTATLKRIAAITHWSASALFGEDDATYTISEDFVAPWESKTYTPAEATANARHVIDHALLRYGKDAMFNKMKMRLTTTFPVGFEGDPANSELDIISSSLTDSLGNDIEANGLTVQYNFSFKQDDAEGMGHNAAGEKITADARLRPKPVGKVSGNITYAAQSLIRYEQVTVTRSDVGKEFSVGGLTFTLKKFNDNLLVLTHNNPQPEIGIVQYNANGEPLKRDTKTFGGGNANIFDFMYAAFEANPALTKEELETIVLANADRFADKDNVNLATIYRSYEGAEKIIIYRPVLCEPVEKTIKVE